MREKSYSWSVEKTEIGDVETIWVASFIWPNQILKWLINQIGDIFIRISTIIQ